MAQIKKSDLSNSVNAKLGREHYNPKQTRQFLSEAIYLIFYCQFWFLSRLIPLNSYQIEQQQQYQFSSMEVTQLMDDAHQIGLTVIWCLLFNVAVIVQQFRENKFMNTVHTLCGFLIGLSTLALALLFLLPNAGISVTIDDDGYVVYIHAIVGIFIIALSFFQWLSGFLANVSRRSTNLSASSILFRKKIHQIVGWVFGYICKANVVMIWSAQEDENYVYWIILIWEGLNLMIVLYLKFLRPKIQETAQYQPIIGREINEIEDISDLKKISVVGVSQYVIVADYIYNIGPLRKCHPAGFQIIDQLNGREIDRFIYGMYSSQFSPETLPHSHSSRFLELAGPPVARLIYSNPYQGFGKSYEYLEVQISLLKVVSSATQIYMLGLTPANRGELIFAGYRKQSQLGQYYSLTVDDSITRLYTSVNCLNYQNIKLMASILQGYSDYRTFKDNRRSSKERSYEIELSLISNQMKSAQQTQKNNQFSYLPLLMKIYNQGKLTNKLRNREFTAKKLVLSQPRGKGLELQHTAPGVIVIVAGGTGLFPFMDFIDLMFKTHLINQAHPQSQRILANDPILLNGGFNKWSFILLLALNQPEDIHALTLQQLNQLSANSNKVQCVMRIKERQEQISSIYARFAYTEDRFDDRLLQEIKRQNLAKVWICGPPKMCSQSVQRLLNEPDFDFSKLLLI